MREWMFENRHAISLIFTSVWFATWLLTMLCIFAAAFEDGRQVEKRKKQEAACYEQCFPFVSIIQNGQCLCADETGFWHIKGGK